MTFPTIQQTAGSSTPTATVASKATAASAGQTFSDALAALASSVGVFGSDVSSFFAQAPSAEKIADAASSLGLTKGQVTQFLDFAAYGGVDHATRTSAVDTFLAQHANQYAIDAQGKVSVLAGKDQIAATSPEKVMPTATDIKAFYASRPTENQETAKAKALGLNAAQFVQFRAIGNGLDINKISAPVLETMFVDSANRLGQDIGGGTHGGWSSYYAPNLGRAITKEEISNFFATNPSQAQIFQKASELGLSVSAINNMMVGVGMTKAQDTNKAYAAMDFALYKGTDGYSMDTYGHIVAGGGHIETLNQDGSRTWIPYTGLRPNSA